MVTAGWRLLAGDCWLAIPCLSMAQGKQEAGGEPRGSLVRAPGWLWRAPGWRREDLEIAPGAMGGPPEVLGRATSDLSLRFPVFGGQRARNIGKHKSGGPSDALALRLCSEIAQGQVKFDPWLMVFWGFRA